MTQRSIEKTEVLIVGGGPSGLVAAMLLARLGVRTIVIERNSVTDEHPKAHELNARSLEILRDIGISEADLAAEASPMEDASRILFCRTINEELGRIDLMADPTRRRKYEEHLQQTLPYLNLSQSEFEKILVARASQSPLIQLRFGHRWESLEVLDGSVRNAIKADGGYSIESRFVLGCDGASSPVRKGAGIEMDGPAEIQCFVNAYFKLNLRDRVRTPAKLYWIMHPEYTGAFVAHHMEKRWIYAVPVNKPWEKPEDFTAEVMRERIQGALGFAAPDLEIASLSTWRMTAQVARRYRKGPVFLVGDAAHRFPPTGGLGMNTGIADAHNLCWKLGLVLNGRAGDELLDTYETERRSVAEKNCAESRANFDNIFEVVRALGLDPKAAELLPRMSASWPMRRLPSGVSRMLRRALSFPAHWLIGRALRPGARRDRIGAAIARQANHFDRLGLDIGYVYAEGALIPDGSELKKPMNDVSDYIPTTTPGARLPHRWIESEGRRESTLGRLVYSSFSLFASSKIPEAARCAAENNLHLVDTASFTSELFPPDQLLLVRPDGHIAWRADARVAGTEGLRAALDSVLAPRERLLKSQSSSGGSE